MLLDIPTMYKRITHIPNTHTHKTKTYLAQNVNRTEIEKSYFSITFPFLIWKLQIVIRFIHMLILIREDLINNFASVTSERLKILNPEK